LGLTSEYMMLVRSCYLLRHKTFSTYIKKRCMKCLDKEKRIKKTSIHNEGKEVNRE